jgi:uncharacterized protein YkwD
MSIQTWVCVLTLVPALCLAKATKLHQPVSTVTPREIASSGCATGSENPVPDNESYELEVVYLTNLERQANGVAPLKATAGNALSRAARYHAQDMGDDNYHDHDTHDRNQQGDLVLTCGTWDRVGAFYSYWAAAENIAAGYLTPADVVDGWMNSSGHRANILNANLWEIGVGYDYESSSDYDRYWVQNFGKRPDVYPIIIELEAVETDQQTVNIYAYGQSQFDEIRFRNETGTWSDWQPFTQSGFTWQLSAGSGLKTVTAEMRNGSTTLASSDEILYSEPRVFSSLKVFLQGGFNGTGQGTLLQPLLPFQSPYPDAKQVSQFPANASDWIYLQLRESDGSTVVAEQSAFLISGGSITDEDGSNQIEWPGVAEGPYYLVVIHRNHLDMMSRNPVSLSDASAACYDFTTDSNQAYGTHSMIQLPAGDWAMVAGDIDGNGVLDDADYSEWMTRAASGSAGYLYADLNLDGNVNTLDYCLYFNGMRSGGTQSLP